jgi:hypothetical protein
MMANINKNSVLNLTLVYERKIEGYLQISRQVTLITLISLAGFLSDLAFAQLSSFLFQILVSK